jgi:hypothetical protein
MFRPMTVHRQKVSCRIQALRYNVKSKCKLNCGEWSVCAIYRVQQTHGCGSSRVFTGVSSVLCLRLRTILCNNFLFADCLYSCMECKTVFSSCMLWLNTFRNPVIIFWPISYVNSKSSPITGLECPRGFQEVKVPRFHDDGTGWW